METTRSFTLEKRLFVEPSASVTRLRFVTVVLFDPEAPVVVEEPTPDEAGEAADETEGDGG